MPERYVTQPGDCIHSIAFERGFFPDTIWNHADNAELKNKRKDPCVLLPGDIVVVPDKRLKELSKPPEKKHRFKRKGVPKTLRIQIKSKDKTMPGLTYTMIIDDELRREGQTDGDGFIVEQIPPNAKQAAIELGDGSEFELQLGVQDPLDTISGIQGRLHALGYYDGPDDGVLSAPTQEALKLFQRQNGLNATGQPDQQSRDALKNLAGG